MAMDAEEARLMLTTAQDHPDLVAQVVPSPFTLAWDRTIQELIAGGYLGELYAVEVRGLVPAFADPAAPLSWRMDSDLSGLNVMGMGIWYEAVARWVGHARRVMAMRKVCVRQRPKAGEPGLAAVRVPDLMDILAEMDCGAQAHFRFSSVLGLAADPAGAWLFGSRGTLHLDTRAGKLLGGQAGDQELKEIAIAPEKRGAWRVEEEFINAIRGREPVRLTTFTEGLKYMQFTEAVARSADSGEAVSLPLFE
jgi:predicted dehydrogenase